MARSTPICVNVDGIGNREAEVDFVEQLTFGEEVLNVLVRLGATKTDAATLRALAERLEREDA